MGIDVGGDELLLVIAKRRVWEMRVDVVQDQRLHVGLGLLLLPEPVQFGQASPDGYQQFAARLLQPFTVGFADVILQQNVEQREFIF